MTAAAIARLAGVGRAAVSNWRRRYPAFPQPVGGDDRRPTFSRAEVEAWLKDTGKGDQLSTAGRTDTGTHRVDQAAPHSAPHSERLPKEEEEQGIAALGSGQLLARAMVALLPRTTAAARPIEAGSVDEPAVLDPACSKATLLLAVADRFGDAVKLVGQEVEESARLCRRPSFAQQRHRPRSTSLARTNAESWAIRQADMLMRNQPGRIHFGNSFSDDGYPDQKFDYMLANPPFGVEWKKVKDEVEAEAEIGHAGRFGAGTPRINDGSFLFLQHLLSKMEPVEGKGTRLGIVFNGSPLFTGAAESGESKIRQWILENDWLEGIVALPDQLFYNTGISTYFWILSNRKSEKLRGKVALVDARDQWEKMRKSFGDKRKQINEEQIKHITELYVDALNGAVDDNHPHQANVKVFKTRDFGYHRITVERPLKLRFEITEDTLAALENAKALAKWDGREALVEALRGLAGSVWWTKHEARDAMHEAIAADGAQWPGTAALLKAVWGAVSVSDPGGEVQKTQKAGVETTLPDPDLRDYENIPLDEDIEEYFAREVAPHVPDAWIDHEKTKVGYEIPFTRHFYVHTPPRPLAEIDAELRELEAQIQKLLGEVTK
ncbi:hypothetical protein SBADM41S_11830 [Streptomyces badius]